MVKTLNLLLVTGILMIFSAMIFIASAVFSFIVFIGVMQDFFFRAYAGLAYGLIHYFIERR